MNDRLLKKMILETIHEELETGHKKGKLEVGDYALVRINGEGGFAMEKIRRFDDKNPDLFYVEGGNRGTVQGHEKLLRQVKKDHKSLSDILDTLGE